MVFIDGCKHLKLWPDTKGQHLGLKVCMKYTYEILSDGHKENHKQSTVHKLLTIYRQKP